MSHRHFCDFVGHEWECTGTALRPIAGDTEPSTCICLKHQAPMEDGDHSECPIELLACPEHREEQVRQMGISDTSDPACGEGAAESDMFKDQYGHPIVGFCLWCDEEFYSIQEVEDHSADDSKACAVFQQFKGGH
jgi:hypothetical protein